MLKILSSLKKKIDKTPYLGFAFLFIRTIVKRYKQDLVTVEAGHLVYVTVLSLVPVVTVLFSILSMLPIFEGPKNEIKAFIFNNLVPTSSDVIQHYLDQFSKNASDTTLIGALTLFVVSMLLINSIDKSINHIWKTKQRRSYVTTFSVYWMVITLGPLLFGSSLVLSSYLVSLRFQDRLNIVASMQEYLIKYLPLLFSFVGLLLMYSVVPIRKVRVRYAVIGALVAAVLFELGKRLFSLYIIYLPSYQNIYGAIAVIPILLVWIYCSWLIIFVGVEIHVTLQELYESREKALGRDSQIDNSADFDINEQ